MTIPFETLATRPGGSQPGCDSGLGPLHRTQLASGVTLLVKEMPRSPAAHVGIWCRAGAAHEDPRQAGIAHFLEHMFFKGTERYGPGEMDRVLKGVGGHNNAATALEHTSYYATVPAEQVTIAIDVLADALQHSVFDPQEIERERRVVEEEILRKEDDPEGKVFLELQASIGDGTPYGRPVLGAPETLRAIDGAAFRSYLEERYTAPNLSVVVTGGVEREPVRAALEAALGDLRGGRPNRIPSFAWAPLARQERRALRDVGSTYLTLGWRVPGLTDLDRAEELELLAAILGEGRGARLVRRLREELGIVTSISAWTWDLSAGGMFAISATLEPGREAAVRAEIERQLAALRATPVAALELERAVNMSVADFRLSTETASDVGETLGHAQVTTGVEELLRYIGRLRAVGRDRLLAAARDWLDPERMTVVAVAPGEATAAPGVGPDPPQVDPHDDGSDA